MQPRAVDTFAEKVDIPSASWKLQTWQAHEHKTTKETLSLGILVLHTWKAFLRRRYIQVAVDLETLKDEMLLW